MYAKDYSKRNKAIYKEKIQRLIKLQYILVFEQLSIYYNKYSYLPFHDFVLTMDIMDVVDCHYYYILFNMYMQEQKYLFG